MQLAKAIEKIVWRHGRRHPATQVFQALRMEVNDELGALAGLIYVYLTLQLYHLGDRKKALENELASLHSQNDVASVQIAALTSRSAMQRRLKEGYLKMIPIAEQNIVRLSAPRPARPEDAVQPVANKRGGR
jgi:hypothetical protein